MKFQPMMSEELTKLLVPIVGDLVSKAKRVELKLEVVKVAKCSAWFVTPQYLPTKEQDVTTLGSTAKEFEQGYADVLYYEWCGVNPCSKDFTVLREIIDLPENAISIILDLRVGEIAQATSTAYATPKLTETEYLQSTEENSKRLTDSIANLKAGNVKQQTLIETN